MSTKNLLGGTPTLLFLLGFGLFMFTRRSELVPLIPAAIFVAPVFILRFCRTQSAARGILLTLAGFVLSMNIALWGLYDVGESWQTIAFNIVRNSLLAVLYFLPYLMDRLVHPRFAASRWLASLTFPAAVTAVMYLASIEGPFDGAVAKSIYAFGPLVYLQLASLTGLWGFVFMASWFASVVNHAWEHGFRWQAARGAATAFAAALLVIVVFGTVKTSSLMRPPSTPVKVAAVVFHHQASLTQALEARSVTPMAQARAQIGSLTRAAAGKGAKIVAFQEFAALLPEAEVTAFHEMLAHIAAENRVYLNVTYGMFAAEGKGKNKSVLIDDRGTIRIDYQKRYLLGVGDVGEPAFFARGPGRLETADTPYGRIAVSICRDADFPAYIQQAGAAGVDIMFNPSFDYPKSFLPDYALRTVENGFSMVRPVHDGLSYAMNFEGRLLASMDSDATGDGILLVDVPTKGVRTLYAQVGDLSGWLAVAGLLVFIVLAARRRLGTRPTDLPRPRTGRRSA